MISYTCPRCQSTMTSPEAMIGKHDKCPKCGTLTVVPRSRPQAVETQPSGRASTFKPVMNIGKQRANPAGAIGVAGFLLGALACLTIWYPIAYLSTSVLGVIGLICAAIAYVLLRGSRKKNIAMPFMGAALCGVAIYFSVFSPVQPAADPHPAGSTAAVPNRPTPPNPTAVLPIGLARQWNNRSLKVLAARIDTIALTSVTGNRRSQDKFLIITIEAANTASRPDQYQQLTYITLRGNPASRARTFASLSDAGKRFYRRVNFGADVYPTGGVSGSAPLGPGKSVRDILVFERPAGATGPYRLELPLGNLGGAGSAVWQIPESALR